MSRRKRGIVVALAVVGGLVAIEVGMSLWRGPEAIVQVENLGIDPIEGLEVASGSSRDAATKVEPGRSVRLRLGGSGPQTLIVKFRQRGNALTAYEVPGFDAGLMRSEGSRLVLQIRPSEVVRYQDEAEPQTPFGRFIHGLTQKVWESLSKEYTY